MSITAPSEDRDRDTRPDTNTAGPTAATRPHGWFAPIFAGVPMLKTAWAAATVKGEFQVRLLALARTLMGLILLRYFAFSAAFGAAVVTSVGAGVSAVAIKIVDDMVNGVFSGVGSLKRYIAPFLMLLGFLLFPDVMNRIPLFATLLEIMAFKLGADLMLKNHRKELRMIRAPENGDDGY